MRINQTDKIVCTLLLLVLMQGCSRSTAPDQSTAAPVEPAAVTQSPVRPADQLIAAAASADAANASSAYRALEEIGYCPYLPDSPETPIGMLTAAYGMDGSDNTRVRETIKLLVQLGCDINQYGASGLTPLHNAVLFRQPVLLRFLVGLGADTKLRIIHVPGSTRGHSIANLDAYGFALALQKKTPDDAAITEIIQFFKTSAVISNNN